MHGVGSSRRAVGEAPGCDEAVIICILYLVPGSHHRDRRGGIEIAARRRHPSVYQDPK